MVGRPQGELDYSHSSSVPKQDMLEAMEGSMGTWECGMGGHSKSQRCHWGTKLEYLADSFIHCDRKRWLRDKVT